MANDRRGHVEAAGQQGGRVLPNGDTDLLKLQFTDLFGQVKMVEMTADSFSRLPEKGLKIDACALTGARDSKGKPWNEALYLVPEMETYRMFPWESGQGKVAGIFCSVCEDTGAFSWADSRNVFRELTRRAENLGLGLSFGFQTDFYLFHTDDGGRPTTVTHEVAGYYDAGSIDLADHVRREMITGLSEVGIEVESAYHGMTPGQNSFVLPPRCAVEAADGFQIFKAAVKKIAKRNGLHAAFMPKPTMDGGGCGLHVKIMVEKMGEEIKEEEFEKQKQLFLLGIERNQHHGMIFTNASVNSYRRLCGEDFGSVPATLLTGEGGVLGIELHHPDASSNIYLSLGAIVASGVDCLTDHVNGKGKNSTLENARTKECNGVESGNKSVTLPLDLGAALRRFADGEGENSYLYSALGSELCRAYTAGKAAEWKRFCAYVTDWEIGEYLYRC